MRAEERRAQRRRLRDLRRAYLAAKPRCWCGRVLSWLALRYQGVIQELVWTCRVHFVVPPDEDCMCDFPRSCGGLGVVYCRGCGGDNCVCSCGGGPIDCDGCEECDMARGRSALDYMGDDYDAGAADGS